MTNIASDYFLFGIPQAAQTDAVLLLATSGLLNSVSGKIQMFVDSVCIDQNALPMFENVQRMSMTATVEFVDSEQSVKFDALGSPAQCYENLVFKFSQLLKQHNDEIYLTAHAVPTVEDLLEDQPQQAAAESTNLSAIQQQVDSWINTIGVSYFDELTNLSNLIEEVGEVARLIGREYGQQSFKAGERPACIKTAIADELSDVLFIVLCLANQLSINLDAAFTRNMDKKTKRDKARHLANPALGAKAGQRHE
ncbi:nucleotide pyrophosphohydrolase [Paraglaciecola aestuariivivens]